MDDQPGTRQKIAYYIGYADLRNLNDYKKYSTRLTIARSRLAFTDTHIQVPTVDFRPTHSSRRVESQIAGSVRMVADPDIPRFLGYVRVAGDSPGTERDSSGPRVSIRLPTRELAI